MKVFFNITAATILACSAAAANEYEPAMQSYLQDNVVTWASDPVLVDAIRAQNARTSGYSQDQIIAMDQDWRAQVGSADAPLVNEVLSNPAAEFLRAQVSGSGGTITEVFVMDAHGLNVAASAATSDMWQGDEAKFQETYPNGPNATHFSDVEFDESTQSYQGQISMSVVDPASGEVIGAITIGVDAESLL